MEDEQVGERTSHEKRGDGCEHHHKERVERSRDVRSVRRAFVVRDAQQERMFEVSNDAAVVLAEC